MLTRNCYLMGFMGAGKSYLAQHLAAHLRCPALDLDVLIEQAEGRRIAAIFEEEGEAYFRAVEARVLRQMIGQAPSIVALGGGAPLHHGNMDWILESGHSIFLDPPLTVLLKRLQKEQAQRPLLAGWSPAGLEREVRERLAERRPVYERAALHVQETELLPLLNRCKTFLESS